MSMMMFMTKNQGGVVMSKPVRVHVIFYSMYGHVYKMAQAIVAGTKLVNEVEASLYQVPELVPQEILEKSGAAKIRATFSHIPLAKTEFLTKADAIIFGVPTRFGNMCAQMRNFLDQTGGLWAKGALIGKIGSVFGSTGTQHGGQETTLTSFHTTLLHHGMIIVGVPYSAKGLMEMREVSGGTPYGATTLANADNSREPSENELQVAKFQGEHVAKITKALKYGHDFV
jgi:NAD(P)H dehydrogenase (quinone)